MDRRTFLAGTGAVLLAAMDGSPSWRHHDRDGTRHGGFDGRRVMCGDHVDLEPHKLSSQFDGASEQRVGITPLDYNGPPFHVAEFTHPRSEGFGKRMRR